MLWNNRLCSVRQRILAQEEMKQWGGKKTGWSKGRLSWFASCCAWLLINLVNNRVWLKETKLERRLSSLDNVFVSWSWVLSLAVMLIEELQCPGRLKTLKKLKGKRLNKLQPLPQTLRLLGILQLDDNHRVSKAATSVLARAAANRNLREKVTAAVLTASLNRHWNTPGVAFSCSLRFAN